MTVLFGKLENMLHNSLYVNFLLTGLVAQLACYPQPLLRSFLQNCVSFLRDIKFLFL